MGNSKLSQLGICIKGAGEMASAVAWRLYMANLRNIVMLEQSQPRAVRRAVSFCEAVYDGRQTVEGVRAERVDSVDWIKKVWAKEHIALVVDPQWNLLGQFLPDVVIDATLAKKNLGTTISEAPLVIALGPGFLAGRDAHFVIETNRGHNLGRIIQEGFAESNTGVPAKIGGFDVERVLRAPLAGVFHTRKEIGDTVRCGELIGRVDEVDVAASLEGVLRGLIRASTQVGKGQKIGDIDPRAAAASCRTISDKGRAIAGSVLEAILRVSAKQRTA